MTYTEKWLDDLAMFKTEKGARLDLRFYIYPDGHGNLHYKDADTGQDRNLPLNGPEEAMTVLRALWERAQNWGVHAAPQASDEP